MMMGQSLHPRWLLTVVIVALASSWQSGHNTGVLNNSAQVIKKWISFSSCRSPPVDEECEGKMEEEEVQWNRAI